MFKLKSIIKKIFFFIQKPRVFKVRHKNKTIFLSTTSDISHIDKIEFGNNVFIWHYSILDGYNNISIGEGCQIGTRVGLFTHSSHHSIRLYNTDYHNINFYNHNSSRVTGPITIGKYTFIGANSIIMPNSVIGKGCIISAFSYVQGDFPEFSIIAGNPAKVVGTVKKIDDRLLKKYPNMNDNYFKHIIQ